MNEKYCAGIVLYNPEIKRLEENISKISKQVKQLILIDNKSNNIEEIKKVISKYNNIELIENKNNMGIAYALNQILDFSKSKKYTWFLTLDQDSVSDENLIYQYDNFINLTKDKRIACITCNIIDRNFKEKKMDKKIKYKYIKYCITSGALMNVEALTKINGYDDKMFIDKVDCDVCVNLIEKGYNIIQINYNGLLHEVGHAKEINIVFRKWILYNHNSKRRYFMCKNAVYLVKKYKKNKYVKKIFLKELFHTIMVLIFEENRKQKLKAALNGFKDGFKEGAN